MKTLIIILFPFLSFSQIESKLISQIFTETSPVSLVSIGKENGYKVTIEADGYFFDNKFSRIYKDLDGSVFFFCRYSNFLFSGFKKELDLNFPIIGAEKLDDAYQMLYENNNHSQWELAHFQDGKYRYIVYALTVK